MSKMLRNWHKKAVNLASNKSRIGVLGAANLSPNMEAELGNLGRMLARDFELHLITGPCSLENNLAENYSHHTYPVPAFNPASLIYAIKACSSFVRCYKPHVLINIAQPTVLGFAVALTGKIFNIPTIIRMTGEFFGEGRIYHQPWKKIKHWILHYLMASSAYKWSSFILAIGDNLKTELVCRNYNHKKIVVLPQPFDRRLFTRLSNAEKIQKKTDLGLISNRKTILFAGRLSWLKGADRILKIVEAVGTKSNAFQFCLVGKGEYGSAFERFPSALVFLPGRVPHSDVPPYFQVADLLIFPSRTEGSVPNTILEALSCKVPVIAAPVGDIQNWVSNLATEPEDYVQYILKGNYMLDELPHILEYDRLKQAYISFFYTVINYKNLQVR